MSVMGAFTLRSLKKNRMRTVVSIVGIALSCALLTAVFTSVSSIQVGLLQRTLATEGSWQVFLPGVPESTLESFVQSDSVVDAAVSQEIGSARLSKQDEKMLGQFLTVKTLPRTVKGSWGPENAPLTIIPPLEEGRLPETSDEVILPDYCKGESLGVGDMPAGVVSDGALGIGSTLVLDLGTRTVDEEGVMRTLNSSQYAYLSPGKGTHPFEEMLSETRQRSVTIVGFYVRQAPSPGSNFTAAASSIVAIAGEEAALLPGSFSTSYMTVQGISSQVGIESFVSGLVGDEGVFPYYHTSLLNYQSIDTGRALSGTLWMVAIVLAAVIMIASISLVYNSFAISVAERTRQFGLLSSIGASKKQLRHSVLFEACVLGLAGIPLGILAGIGGVAVTLACTQEAFAALLGSDSGLRVHVDPVIVCVSAALSLATLLLSAGVPAMRAGRVSAVDAIRQTQDVRVSKRAERKAAKRIARHDIGAVDMFGRFGAAAFLACRSLARTSARGRTVVASLAVGVALIVIAGSVSTYLTPISDRSSSKNAAGSGADVVVTAHVSDMGESGGSAAILDDFLSKAESVEGVEFIGSFKQGQVKAIVPEVMISDAGRRAHEEYDAERSAPWASPTFAKNGDYFGDVKIFYLDDASWSSLVHEMGLDEVSYSDQEYPRAIGLNRYQGATQSGSYVDIEPFSQIGAIDLYGIERMAGWTITNIQESETGELVVGYIDQNTGDVNGQIMKPLREVSFTKSIEVGALTNEEPAVVNSGSATSSFPTILLPESLAVQGKGASTLNAADGLYDNWWANFSFTAEDSVKATKELEGLAGEYGEVTLKVFDVASSARQNRLVSQAVQFFIFSFSAITMLIAVANVFNTLANSIILRRREFAILKSTGMGDRAFARMLVCECASYALRGLGIGLLLATLATFLLYQAASLSFVGLQFTLPWTFVALAVAVVLAVLALSVVFALRKSHVSCLVDALRADAL